MIERPLKALAASKLEEALSESISKLLGKEYSVSIENMDFESGGLASASLFDSVDMKINISKKQDKTSE